MFATVRVIVLGLSLTAGPAVVWAADKPADSISGRVVFNGTPPKPKKIDPAVDAHCSKAHAKTPIQDEKIVVGKDGGLKNVFVEVTGGLPKDKKYDVPAQPVLLDQKGCTYVPHVVGIQVGQVLQVVNSDDTNHNVHGHPTQNQEFNQGQPKKGMKNDYKMTQREIFPIKCDVHQWMGAWAHVVPHPFFAVTDENGNYTIKGLPAGDYELTYYQEGKKFTTQKVKLEAGKPASAADVKFSTGKKPAVGTKAGTGKTTGAGAKTGGAKPATKK